MRGVRVAFCSSVTTVADTLVISTLISVFSETYLGLASFAHGLEVGVAILKDRNYTLSTLLSHLLYMCLSLLTSYQYIYIYRRNHLLKLEGEYSRWN